MGVCTVRVTSFLCGNRREKTVKTLWTAVVAVLVGVNVSVASPANAAGGCALDPVDPAADPATAGTLVNPWTVGSVTDFALVGDGDCARTGHYRQTASFSLALHSDRALTNASFPFSGSYDGDFHTIALEGEWSAGTISIFAGVFGEALSGTVKRLKLTGDLVTSRANGNPLVAAVKSGGVVSQVSSSVNVTALDTVGESVLLGGLVGSVDRGGLVEYSSASGTLSWTPPEGGTRSSAIFGGLAAQIGVSAGVEDPATSSFAEIRDSYSTVTFKWPLDAASRCSVLAGGLVGVKNQLSGDVFLVRSYSATQLADEDMASTTGCTLKVVRVGGLVGRSGDVTEGFVEPRADNRSYLYFLSSFFASDRLAGTTNSIGLAASGLVNQQYQNRLPVAVGLDSDYLRQRATFQSRESTSALGAPDGAGALPTGNSGGVYPTGSTLTADPATDPNAETYRWAIEQGDQEVFIASDYATVDSDRFFTRSVFTDLSVPRGETRLTQAVQNYPSLGRVWEVCLGTNDGFPVLIWEGYSCTGGEFTPSLGHTGDSDSAGATTQTTPPSAAMQADVTTQGPELAATGADVQQATALAASAGLLMAVGALMVVLRRLRTG